VVVMGLSENSATFGNAAHSLNCRLGFGFGAAMMLQEHVNCGQRR